MPRFATTLTGRGAALLGIGLVLGSGAWILRESALLWPAIFLGALPLAGLVAVLAGDPGLAVVRRVDPDEVEADEPAEVDLTLRQRRPSLAGTLVVEERVPRLLGQPRRFVVPPPGVGRSTRESYVARAARRGRYRLDDLRYSFSDALGVARREVRNRAGAELVVLPRVLPLSPAAPAASGRTGETPIPHLALSGADDVLVREYRPRDDVRRIHWPSTARTGTLMVRREEQAWDPVAWVVLDTRAASFAAGEAGAEGFEWLVTLAASVGATLLAAGYQVGLAEAHGATFESHPGDRGAPVRMWQRHLVDVQRNGEPSLTAAVRVVAQGPADHLVVALLGSLSLDDARELVQLRSGELRCWAFTLDAPGAGSPEEERAVELLAQHGWRHDRVYPGVDPDPVWRAIAAPLGGRR